MEFLLRSLPSAVDGKRLSMVQLFGSVRLEEVSVVIQHGLGFRCNCVRFLEEINGSAVILPCNLQELLLIHSNSSSLQQLLDVLLVLSLIVFYFGRIFTCSILSHKNSTKSLGIKGSVRRLLYLYSFITQP